jgi:hypothetical protein
MVGLWPGAVLANIGAMKMRHLQSRWAAWAFALALVLKAAVPLLATASAQIQGKPLAEVCTVYGVATVTAGDAEPPPLHDGVPSHSGDHCTLGALVALSAPAPQATVAPPGHRPESPGQAARAAIWPDACAAWVAQLKHGPPAFA